MSSIKRVLSVILILALALMSFGGLSGCQTQAKSDEPICILVDAVSSKNENAWKRDFTQFMNKMDVPQDYEIEFLPDASLETGDSSERDIRIASLRTEIMAGEGPDLFIIFAAGEHRLFLTPEKNMALGQFYPLDDFIKKAKYMDWDALTPEVMAGGHSEQYGQVILPISYWLPVACFKKDDLPEAPAGNSWQDVLTDESGFLQVPNALIEAFKGTEGRDYGFNFADCTFGPAADYAASPRQLNFTEEELLQRMTEIVEIEQKASVNAWGLPEYFTTRIGTDFANTNSNDVYRDHIEGSVISKPLTMVPPYSDDGGVAVRITCYAAINANSKRAKDAFALLDAFLSPQAALELDFYSSLASDNVLVFEDALSPDFAAAYSEAHKDDHDRNADHELKWSFNQENFDEFTRIRRQITCAQFCGDINLQVEYLLDYCLSDPDNMEQLVHETYQRIRQMLGE